MFTSYCNDEKISISPFFKVNFKKKGGLLKWWAPFLCLFPDYRAARLTTVQHPHLNQPVEEPHIQQSGLKWESKWIIMLICSLLDSKLFCEHICNINITSYCFGLIEKCSTFPPSIKQDEFQTKFVPCLLFKLTTHFTGQELESQFVPMTWKILLIVYYLSKLQ